MLSNMYKKITEITCNKTKKQETEHPRINLIIKIQSFRQKRNFNLVILPKTRHQFIKIPNHNCFNYLFI